MRNFHNKYINDFSAQVRNAKLLIVIESILLDLVITYSEYIGLGGLNLFKFMAVIVCLFMCTGGGARGRVSYLFVGRRKNENV